VTTTSLVGAPESRPPADTHADVRPPARRTRPWALVALVALGAGLRIAWSTNFGLSFDETFTAMAGRRPFGDLFSYLAGHDTHPPLDYVLRAPLARLGAPDLAFRGPSILFSVAALALFAWWMRDRGMAGVCATGLLAVSGFAIAYGSEARMYALLELLGVVAAVLAEAWLARSRRWHAWAVGGLVLVGCVDHASTFLLAGALVLLAGLRTDRDAWRWRAGVVAGVAAWAALWGPEFLQQFRGEQSLWIPPTTPRGFVEGVTSQVTFTDGIVWLVAVAVVAGAVCLARRERRLFTVWAVCGAVPFVVAAAIGMVTPFFLNRTLTLAAWAPALAVGMALDAVWRRWKAIGAALVAVTMLLALPGTVSLLEGTWQYDTSTDRLERSARPGDVVAVAPTWYEQLVDWRIGVRAPLGNTRHVELPGLPDADALLLTAGKRTGRIWLLEFGAARPSLRAFRRCAPTWTYSESRVLCLVPRTHAAAGDVGE
jgi:uncharacterized membrane protein